MNLVFGVADASGYCTGARKLPWMLVPLVEIELRLPCSTWVRKVGLYGMRTGAGGADVCSVAESNTSNATIRIRKTRKPVPHPLGWGDDGRRSGPGAGISLSKSA